MLTENEQESKQSNKKEKGKEIDEKVISDIAISIFHFIVIQYKCKGQYLMKEIMRRNFTLVTEFILLGLSNTQELQILFFVLFFTIYMVTVAGNIGIIVLIRVNAHLHMPMYFFLSHLSFMDLCFSSIVTPKMLGIFLSGRKTISYIACMVHCYCFIALLHVGIYILAVMAFDQYTTICTPLLYGSRMYKGVCTSLMMVPYVYGALTGLMETM